MHLTKRVTLLTKRVTLSLVTMSQRVLCYCLALYLQLTGHRHASEIAEALHYIFSLVFALTLIE